MCMLIENDSEPLEMALQTVVFVLAFIGGFTSAYAEKTDLNDILFSGNYEFVDLTHPFDNNTVYWINSNKFAFTRQVADEDVNGSWYASNDFSAGEHGGTHLDAPYHFFKEGLQVGDLPLEKLIVPLIVVDVSSMTNDNPNFVLTKHDLDDGIINYNMGKPCLMVFKFGWSKYFNNEKKYLGLSDGRTLNFPGLSRELVQWLTTAYKNIVGIGVDVASVDPGSSMDFPVHKVASRSGLYNIENINFHKNIPEHGCTALVLPMKIASGTGAPLRLVAICPKQKI